jgi:hypothetical protein
VTVCKVGLITNEEEDKTTRNGIIEKREDARIFFYFSKKNKIKAVNFIFFSS